MSLADERFSLQCPNCNARYVYQSSNLTAEGQVSCQNCGQWIVAEGQSVAAAPSASSLESYMSYSKRSDDDVSGMIIAKMYAHGLVFSLITPFISIVFVFLTAILALFGGLIGLFFALLFLAVMFGGVNIGLAGAIWGIRSKSDYQSVLGQGGLLFIVMIVLGLILLPLAFLGFGVTLILDFTLFPFVYGLVCRGVALSFEVGSGEDVGVISDLHRSGKCPHCNARYAYHISSRDEQGNVSCQNCTQKFVVEVGLDIE